MCGRFMAECLQGRARVSERTGNCSNRQANKEIAPHSPTAHLHHTVDTAPAFSEFLCRVRVLVLSSAFHLVFWSLDFPIYPME